MGLNLLPNFQIGGGLKGFLLKEGCWEKRGGGENKLKSEIFNDRKSL